MGRIKDERLFEMFRRYFTEYLPNHRSASKHTCRAYQNTLEQYLEFLKAQHSVTLFELSFSMMTAESIQGFLAHLKEKGTSDATIRQRFASLKAFLKYCADADTALAVYYLQTDTVAVKTAVSVSKVDYLSEKAIRILIEQPDPTTSQGQRDRFLMILMYDTGARIDEILSVRICDIHAEPPAKIQLHGKGRKTRTVPLSERTVMHYRKYISRFHPQETMFSEKLVFFTVRNGRQGKMCPDTVRAFLRKYGQAAEKLCSEIPSNVHPHLFRHSRAMHLYQGGMDLTLVSQWLGHANLQTTLVYAHADTEMKRKAIEQATGTNNPLQIARGTRAYTVNDEETLKKLYGLK